MLVTINSRFWKYLLELPQYFAYEGTVRGCCTPVQSSDIVFVAFPLLTNRGTLGILSNFGNYDLLKLCE